jgi:hypothetical protein
MTEGLGHGGAHGDVEEWAAPFDRACERLVEAIMGREWSGGRALLKEIAATLGLAHIACERFDARNGDVAERSSLTTWPEAWRVRTAGRRTADIDPVVMVGTYARHPFDWRSFRVLSSDVASFLEDAAGHGVGLNGLTVPLRGGPTALALVSFTSDMARDDWDAYKRSHLPNLKTLACLVCVLAGVSPRPVPRPVSSQSRLLAMFHARLS